MIRGNTTKIVRSKRKKKQQQEELKLEQEILITEDEVYTNL